MDMSRFDSLTATLTRGFSRRAVLRRLGGGGLVAALAATGARQPGAAAQSATPAGATVTWQTLHLEVALVPTSTSITKAGGGPPQRGDFFYADAPIYAAGNVGGQQIGTYECFGVWTQAATDTKAPDQRLTSVRYRLPDGVLVGLINEGGADQAALVGPVQGGTGRYAGAGGTFRQIGLPAGAILTPGGTPVTAPSVQAVFDLLLPVVS